MPPGNSPPSPDRRGRFAGRWAGLFSRFRDSRWPADAAPVAALLAVSCWLTGHLFDWKHSVLTGDLPGSWAWFYWLKQSIVAFHQLPTWSPLWSGGIPFFGMVAPGSYLLVLPFYLVTGEIPAAFDLAIIVVFALAGGSMYAYLRRLSGNRLCSFLGAAIYLVLPVHSNAMLFWGHLDLCAAYALAPLVLLFTDRSLDGMRSADLILAALTLSCLLLAHIEYALIFTLFYVCYLAFALAVRRAGWRRTLGLLAGNKAATAISFLILLLPLSFYLVCLTQYHQFSGLTPDQVEGGLYTYTFRHFGDAFQARLSGGLQGYSEMPEVDYYCGGASFLVFLSSLAFVLREKGEGRARLLFFLMMALTSLILCLGAFGPLYSGLTWVVPLFSGMRAPVRLYYVFAICLPILFSLSFLSLARLLDSAPRVPARLSRLIRYGAPVVLVVALVLDFSPYLGFYRNNMVNEEAFNRVSSFVAERIRADNQAAGSLPGDNVSRVLVLPSGAMPDRISRLDQDADGQFTIEVSQTWLPWNQYQAADDFSATVYDRILYSQDSLEFYSELLFNDYVMTYEQRLPSGSRDESYAELMDYLEQTLDSICGGGSGILADRGSLDTQYYRVHLYRTNHDPSARARFYALGDTLLMSGGDGGAPHSLAGIYDTARGLAPQLTPQSFLDRVAVVSGESGLLAPSASGAAVDGWLDYGGRLLLLQNDGVTARVLEAEDCQAEGWDRVDRRPEWGIQSSGVDMALPDATGREDNFLKQDFQIESEGAWIVSTSYLSSHDTGIVEVYIDEALVDTIDTSGLSMGLRSHAVTVELDPGRHQLRLAGRSRGYVTEEGEAAGAGWVEVDRTVLLNQAWLPEVSARSESLWSDIARLVVGASAPFQSFEAEDMENEEWVRIGREESQSVAASGVTMAVPDAAADPGNRLSRHFLIGQAGDWALSVTYLSYADTGTLLVYVDDKLVDTIETSGPALALRDDIIPLSLGEGIHRVTLAGAHSSEAAATGSGGNWVEVDAVRLMDLEHAFDIVGQAGRQWAGMADGLGDSRVDSWATEAEYCESAGWIELDREEEWGLPTSGSTMAVGDASAQAGNYIGWRFFLARAGDWSIDAIYLADVNTGVMQIYVDGLLVDQADTSGPGLAVDTRQIRLALGEGPHEIRIAGAPGARGAWVEVDRIVCRNQGQAVAPAEEPAADPAIISGITLTPRSIRLDLETAEEGILSTAYYANPWWRAYVDGRETEVLTVNGVLAGCRVPAGRHHVEFIYDYPAPANFFSLWPR